MTDRIHLERLLAEYDAEFRTLTKTLKRTDRQSPLYDTLKQRRGELLELIRKVYVRILHLHYNPPE
jgi:glutathione peroxidase-family protein